MIGKQIGSYQILSLLGSGGMGEVYRARDTKLGRDVAIKVLPSLFANDPDRLARFAREARLLASLNHPHIATIHGLESADGVQALVMELVDGPTLGEKLTQDSRRGVKEGLPIAEALRIGGQIAEALEGAHEKGVIHRDLKPNIKLSHDGHVKVLDFGLAKAFSSDGSGGDLSQAPTITATQLQAGAIVGTPAYMSPEQARGQAIDKRSDIWGFGCVLYEMLTGRAVFPRETITDTFAAILEREPEWGALPANTPAGIRQLLRRCLDKDPKRRLHDIADARIEIEDVRSGRQQDQRVTQAPADSLAAARLGVGPGGRHAECCCDWRVGSSCIIRRSRSAAGTQHAAHQGALARDLARWTEDCFRGKVRSPVSVVAAAAGLDVGAAVGRDRTRHITVLVARQPVDRVLCRYQAEAHGHRRRIAADAGFKYSSRSRGHVEQRRHDPLCREFRRTDFPHLR